MNRQPRLATWIGTILGSLCALLFAAQAQAWPGKVTEEFHHSYPLAADGRIELDNINGAVHITAWDQNQVKIDAVKYANTKERLDQAKIEVEADNNFISIRTKYADHDLTWSDGDWNNPASVEYTLMVPRNVRLDEIKLVNGPLDLHGLTGEVRASTVNGKLDAQGLQGRVELSAVNGRLNVQFDRLGNSPVDLSAVNGELEVTLPSDAQAELEASTVNGGIENDLGLHVNHHRYVGHDLHGELGSGGTRMKLSNVNGHIDIRHANDGRAMSPVKDLSGRDRDDDDNI
jgi:DUF4097 and DUF4098 domain-containing protein YvlB